MGTVYFVNGFLEAGKTTFEILKGNGCGMGNIRLYTCTVGILLCGQNSSDQRISGSKGII